MTTTISLEPPGPLESFRLNLRVRISGPESNRGKDIIFDAPFSLLSFSILLIVGIKLCQCPPGGRGSLVIDNCTDALLGFCLLAFVVDVLQLIYCPINIHVRGRDNRIRCTPPPFLCLRVANCVLEKCIFFVIPVLFFSCTFSLFDALIHHA